MCKIHWNIEQYKKMTSATRGNWQQTTKWADKIPINANKTMKSGSKCCHSVMTAHPITICWECIKYLYQATYALYFRVMYNFTSTWCWYCLTLSVGTALSRLNANRSITIVWEPLIRVPNQLCLAFQSNAYVPGSWPGWKCCWGHHPSLWCNRARKTSKRRNSNGLPLQPAF